MRALEPFITLVPTGTIILFLFLCCLLTYVCARQTIKQVGDFEIVFRNTIGIGFLISIVSLFLGFGINKIPLTLQNMVVMEITIIIFGFIGFISGLLINGLKSSFQKT